MSIGLAGQTMSTRSPKLQQTMAKPADPLDEIVRGNLKKFREEAQISQAESAELSGIPIDNLRRYENGVTGTVPGTVLKQLAKVYGHSVDDFFDRSPPPARLEDRPVFFLRTRPGVEVDAETHQRLQDIIDKANREVRTRRKK